MRKEHFFIKYATPRNIIFSIVSIVFILFMIKVPDIAIMFFASYVIACSLDPLVTKLSDKYPRDVSSILVLLVLLCVIVVFFIPVFVLTTHEVSNFAQNFPQYIANIKHFILTNNIFYKADDIALSDVISSTSNMTSAVIENTITFGKSVGSGIIYLIIFTMSIYYFLADKDIIQKNCIRLFPVNMRDRVNEITSNISDRIGGYMIAQVATMASVGIIMIVGLLLIRNEYALLLGIITSVLDIIPIVGPAIALVICLTMVYKSGIITVFLVTAIFCIAQLVENNFVRPYVFGKFLNIHPLLIYLFLFLAAKYLGIIGVVFAPAIAATVIVLTEEIYIKNLE